MESQHPQPPHPGQQILLSKSILGTISIITSVAADTGFHTVNSTSFDKGTHCPGCANVRGNVRPESRNRKPWALKEFTSIGVIASLNGRWGERPTTVLVLSSAGSYHSPVKKFGQKFGPLLVYYQASVGCQRSAVMVGWRHAALHLLKPPLESKFGA